MTFALPRGSVVARVRITQAFAADGAHALQTVTGDIIGGSGRFTHARGSLTGGGTLIDTRAGVREVRLTYTLTIERWLCLRPVTVLFAGFRRS